MADLGDTLRFKSDLTDGSGILANASGVTLTITLPDGTAVTPSITNPPTTTGKYLYDYATTLASPPGLYRGQWLFTMAGGATTSFVETLDVGASLVTTDEAIRHLRAAGIITSESDLEQLQWLCFVATDAVERDLDLVIAQRSITSTFDGGCTYLRLKRPPRADDGGAITISSVTVDGGAVTDYVLRKTGWRLMRTSCAAWSWGVENISVTYTAGCVNPPRVVRKVCLNAVQGMWQESQQAFHPELDQFADSAVAVAAGALTPVERNAYDSLRSLLGA